MDILKGNDRVSYQHPIASYMEYSVSDTGDFSVKRRDEPVTSRSLHSSRGYQ